MRMASELKRELGEIVTCNFVTDAMDSFITW
jgi:hypothetical protein